MNLTYLPRDRAAPEKWLQISSKIHNARQAHTEQQMDHNSKQSI